VRLPTISSETIKNWLKWKELNEKERKIKEDIEILKNGLGENEDIDLIENKIKDLINGIKLLKLSLYKLEKLNNIKIVKLPKISSEIILNWLKYKEIEVKIKNIKEIIEKLEINQEENITSNILREIIQEKSVKHKNIYQLYHEYNEVKKQSDIIREQLNEIDLDENIDNKYDELKNKIESKNKIYELYNYSNIIYSELNEINKYENEIKEIVKNIKVWNRLKELSIKTEKEMLDLTVNNINITLSKILSTIFLEPITVRLQLNKQNKTNELCKDVVNFSILYKNIEYDNIEDMSGGEADRISLGLIITLNRLTGCPFIMLDECISSLDATLRTKCCKVLKKWLISKTILTVLHETVEGDFDQVIDV